MQKWYRYATLGALAVVLIGVQGVAARAQSAPANGFTDEDAARLRKLDATIGYWLCHDSPAGMERDTITTTREGNFYVSRETGSTPHTTYTRWSHALQRYVATTLYDAGGTFVFTTTADDPNDAVWQVVFPTPGMMSPTAMLQNYRIKVAGSTMTFQQQYYDAMQTLKSGSAVCVKTS